MKKRLLALVLLFAVIITTVPSIDVNAEEPEDSASNETVEVEDMAVSDEKIDTESLDVTVEGKKVKVAILDTGTNETEYTKERLLEKCNDDNGHGTVIGDIIASNTNENVEIIPIKVFDKEGKADVDILINGINEAIEKGADVINISASSEGYSEKLAEAIENAHSQGIYVVVSAGNRSDVTTKYMPSFSTDAVVVSATDKNGEFAFYSNFGRTVDFSANGTYSDGNVTYNGTSIAAARVSSYIALLLEQGRNVDQCLLNCKEDKGDEGFDNYYGNGYLCLDYIKSQLDCKDEVEQIGLQEIEEKVDYNDYSEFSNDIVQVAGGWYYDYWMVGSWGDFIDGAWNHGAHKFVLVNDVSISELWTIDTGCYFTISGNGHQLVNNRPDNGPMILVQNGAVLTTENNLVLNGNNHRNNGANNEGGSSCVDCINATFYANNTIFCNNWNYGYSYGVDDLGGGTGFNIVAENGTYPAVGIARECIASNCDGAAFFVRNSDGKGATMECYDCLANNSSWGFMTTAGTMKLERCEADASRSDPSRSIYGPYGGCGICFIGGTGSAYDCDTKGANYGIWASSDCYFERVVAHDSKDGFHGSRGYLNDCECKNNSDSGVCCDGDVTVVSSKIHDNSYGLFNVGTTTMKNTNVHTNSTYDAYQDGTLYVSGTTSCKGKGIYLPSGRYVTVNEALSGDNKVVLAEGTNQLGRLVVSYNTNLGNGVLNRFILSSIKTTSGRNGILRCGVGTNGALGHIVLSERYSVTYKANLNKAGVSETVPGLEYFYWKEEGTLKTGQRPVLTKNGRAYAGYSFKNWNTNKYGVGTAYTNNTKITLSNDLVLYAIYVDDVKPTAGITVTPTTWDDVDGLVTIRAIDEGSGLARIELYRRSLVTNTEKVVQTYYFNGDNDERTVTFNQSDEGEFIFIAKVYDKNGNMLVLTSDRMKIDKSNPQIRGLEDTNTEWTNVSPVISVRATDYLKDTSYTGSGVKQLVIIDDKGKTVASGKDSARFVITEKYEGTHTFTVKVSDNLDHETTDTITTRYDCTAPVMNGTETSSVDNSVYVGDNVIDQEINDYYTNSKNANDSSGINKVVLYEYRNGKLEEVKNISTRTEFNSPNNKNAFHEKYKVKEKDKDVEYYLLEAYDFAGNKSVKKITSQRYLLTLFRTSIDDSSYV